MITLPTPWFVFFLLLVTATLVAIGVIRNRRFRFRQRLAETLAEEFGLGLAYQNHRDFAIYGGHRGYQLSIRPLTTRDNQEGLSLAVFMNNPNRRMLIVAKEFELEQLVLKQGMPDQISVMHIGLGDGVSVWTNDLMFASLLLTENVKIALFQFLKTADAAAIFLQDDELTCMIPGILDSTEQLELSIEAMRVLIEMKAAL